MEFDEGVASAGMDWDALTACVFRMTRVRTAVLGFRVSDDLQLFLTEASANRLERLRLERKLRYAFRERGQPEEPWVVYEGAECAGEWEGFVFDVCLWWSRRKDGAHRAQRYLNGLLRHGYLLCPRSNPSCWLGLTEYLGNQYSRERGASVGFARRVRR